MKKLLFISFVCFLCASCASNTKEEFFEGVVTPGIVTGVHYNTTNAAGLKYTIKDEITINPDHSFELRRKESGFYDGGIEIKTFYGTIRKHVEEYNGINHVWFTLSGVSDDNWSTGLSIEPNGSAYSGAHNEYHYINLSKTDISDYHWQVVHE